MLGLVWLIPALPLAGALILAIGGARLGRRVVAWIGVGSIALATIVAMLITWAFLASPPAGNNYTRVIWTWLAAGGFHAQIAFYLDALSVLMVLVVTFVSFLIHLYSAEFMIEDEGYSRFFCYMNLFVASMVTLLLGNNLLLLYLGWEGVGLCSYLLIGFWYTDPANGRAAQKAFIVTRVGDSALIIGLFLLYHQLGTLDIQPLMQRAAEQWPVGSSVATAAALLLLGGAVGKSAQLPLQTWLPDAMAGPTPTSALIHAATMVTAGVYLLARTHVLYSLSPVGQLAVAVVGAVTLLVAGCSALTQNDIKRVLAYSTVSQIGYMFLACGVGAWSAAIFHFMTHAFFKALLFLAAGVVIEALHHEHDIFKMGALRKELPVAFWTFLIAGCSLAGLPLITAGFYSKGLIIWSAGASETGSVWLWLAGVVGVFLTAAYIFRVIFVVFFGAPHSSVSHRPGWAMQLPLVVLAFLSIVGGWVNLPVWLGNHPAFEDFLHLALPPLREGHAAVMGELGSEGIVTATFIVGVFVAWLLYVRRPELSRALTAPAWSRALHRFWFTDWGMDWLYDRAFVRPTLWFARVDRDDWVDLIYTGIAEVCVEAWRGLQVTQSGKVRWYAAGITIGTVIFVFLALIL
ncbi:MAG TPA: NADH-quinone oxidoreductase subunit L [Gemmatimonadaceae bacterium]|nr:NADH-quinone oxidoreductase subunit L [Gemmatimonadaceae bacterium]